MRHVLFVGIGRVVAETSLLSTALLRARLSTDGKQTDPRGIKLLRVEMSIKAVVFPQGRSDEKQSSCHTIHQPDLST
jgi:hypothetical protein